MPNPTPRWMSAKALCALLLAATVLCGIAAPASAGIDEGYVAYLKGDFAAALDEWRPLARAGNAEAANDIAYVLAQQGVNLVEALLNARLAIEKMPDNPAVLDTMGWVLFRLGRYADALPYLEAAEKLAPTDAEVVEHVGDAYWQSGRRIDAQTRWRTAYTIADDDAAARLRRKLGGGYEPPTPGTLAGVVLDLIPGRLFTRAPVEIRTSPQPDAAAIGVMAPGTAVTIVGVVRGKEWLAAEAGGIWGYVPAADLERTP